MKIKDTKKPRSQNKIKPVKLKLVIGFILFLLLFSLTIVISINYGIKLHKTNTTSELRGLFVNLKNTRFNIITNFLNGRLSNPKQLFIDIKHIDFQKMAYNRDVSLKRGFITNEVKQEEIPGKIMFDGERKDVSFRMMGQNLDHIVDVNKWSLKVKVKGNNTIMGMKEFSLINPFGRNSFHNHPINEWLCHQLEEELGLMSLRFDFVEVSINGKNNGIYAIEEHFEKRLIENNRLREGLLFKPSLKNIDVYNEKKVLSKPQFKEQYILLSSLWKSFLIGDIATNNLFDIEKLAKYYALADLVNGHHTHWLGNTQYYFNPITRLIEPIGREWESPYHKEFSLYYDNPQYEFNYHKKIFGNLEFVEKYIETLEYLAKPDFLDSFFKEIEYSLDENISILNSDFPAYSFSNNFLYENQKKIRSVLAPNEDIINSFYHGKQNGKIILSCFNTYSYPIEILDLTLNDSIVLKSSNNKIIVYEKDSEYFPSQLTSDSIFKFQVPTNTEIPSGLPNLKIRYKILGTSIVMESVVIPWPESENGMLNRFPIHNEKNISEFEFIRIDEVTKTIVIEKGDWILNDNLIIPKGYTVNCGAGTKINLLNSSKILSYSTLNFRGSETDPIIVYSSDSTGEGIMVFNSQQTLIFNHVTFSHLSNPSQAGWSLSGSINIYESPVEFHNCKFANNKKGDDNLNIIRSDFIIDSCLFINSYADALDADFSNGSILNSVFSHTGNDCIDVSGSNIDIENVKLDIVGDKGISGGEGSSLIMSDIQVTDSEIAIASKDASVLKINTISITDTKIGFTAFQKKSEYDHPKIEVVNYQLTNVDIPFLLEENSIILADNNYVQPDRKNVKEILYGVEYGKSSK